MHYFQRISSPDNIMESVHYSRVYIKGKETKVERNESAIPPYPRLRCLRAEPTSVVSRTPAVTRKERFLYRRIWFLGFSAASPTGIIWCSFSTHEAILIAHTFLKQLEGGGDTS
ncbi:hypothetical protein C4D60_Mb08t11750 [Musa balbisiana]|uniref:Uncharacterized protein n=1 Tax=Musa balbisiana TaxID=52838 RepID=A0A4S8K328_MUSBA|nr:hypothetical protein C4D60_Mb08t11750 [Musa balbisiana]